ncbi:hypothetical protein L6164_000803 [Bauhinia variegata]|uniref:Uncharacterized protein n=1 Tax=Bauhinia variegata TaxID=167791 RepID=A0ACB9Q8Z0_BAUVA|nr:hypothetical protein L6164_000803 [Bauhinia variegata]
MSSVTELSGALYEFQQWRRTDSVSLQVLPYNYRLAAEKDEGERWERRKKSSEFQDQILVTCSVRFGRVIFQITVRYCNKVRISL